MGQAFSDRRGASPNVQTRRRAVVATEVNGHQRSFRENEDIDSRVNSRDSLSNFADYYAEYFSEQSFYEPPLSPSCLKSSVISPQLNGVTSPELSPSDISEPSQYKPFLDLGTHNDYSRFDNRSDVDNTQFTVYDGFHSTSHPIVSEVSDESIIIQTIPGRSVVLDCIHSGTSLTLPQQLSLVSNTKQTIEEEGNYNGCGFKMLNAVVTLESDSVTPSNSDLSAENNEEQKEKERQNNKNKIKEESEIAAEISKLPDVSIDNTGLNAKNSNCLREFNSVENKCVDLCQSKIDNVKNEPENILETIEGSLNDLNTLKLPQGECLLENSEVRLLPSQHIYRDDGTYLNNGPASVLDVNGVYQTNECFSETLKEAGGFILSKTPKTDKSCQLPFCSTSSSTIATTTEIFCSASTSCDSGEQFISPADSVLKISHNVNTYCDSENASNECLKDLTLKETVQPSKLLTENNPTCSNSADLIANRTGDNLFSNPTSLKNQEKQIKNDDFNKPCDDALKKKVSLVDKIDLRPQQMFANATPPNVIKPEKSVNKTSPDVEDKAVETPEILGSFEAYVVQCFPKSRVATFTLKGETRRAYFFLSNVENGEIPSLDSIVILKNLTRVPESQLTKIYQSNIHASLVTVPKERKQPVSGRTGAIVSFINSETGVLPLQVGQEKLLGSFTRDQVRGMNFKGRTLQKVWPVGTIVHFCGEVLIKFNKKEFLVSKVWPQGGQDNKLGSQKKASSTNNEKITKQTETTKGTQLGSNAGQKVIRVDSLRALSGKVSRYLENGNGIVQFRYKEIELQSQFNASLCCDLVPGIPVSKQWRPPTQVHFDGELTTYENHSKFTITCIWSKRPVLGQVYEGEIIELLLPNTFIVSSAVSGEIAKIAVSASVFRLSPKELQLNTNVDVKTIVHLGQRISVRVQQCPAYNGCKFIATDAWPSEVVSFGKKLEVVKNPIKGNVGSEHLGPTNSSSKTPPPLSFPVQQPIKDPFPQNTVESSGTLPCNKSKSILKTSSVSKLTTNCTSSNQSCKATRAPSAEPVRPGMPLGQEPKTLTAKVGVARRGRVINVSPDVALLSVQTPVRHGSDEAAVPVVAALASKMHLYGVPLMNVNLTTVLSKGQELEEVHLLPSDEKCLSKFSSSSAAKANPLLQNTEIVSAVWLGPAHFESPSLQFAELTKYCRVHKVPETTRHMLTLRLGQLLGEDGRKPIKTSWDGELEAVEGSYKNKSENNKLKSPLAVLDEGMLLAQIKDMGPEKFLCVQLKQLMHSVLKDSVRSTQEFFLSSLKENLGGTELYNTMAAQTPAIMDATLREFLQEQLLQEGVADGGTVCAPTSNVAASDVNVNASAESTTALVARSPPTTAYAATAAASAASAASAAIVPPTMQPLPKAVTSGVSGQSSAASVSAALHLGIRAAPSVTVEDASDGALGVVNDCTDVRDKDLKGKSEQRGAAGSPDVTCLLLRGVKEVLQAAKKGLKASSDVPLCAMQEPVKKPSKIEVADQLTGSSAVSETTSRESKSEASEVKPVLDVPDTGEPDKRDFQKTLCAELQKHAKELAIFRDEACSLIENWKSQDSPPATPEELEFLQELSSLLDNKVEDNGKAGKNEEDTSLVAQQLIKFWNTANFPLTPVAQRGLQRLQELFGAPNKKMQGNEKECLGSGGDGLVEVEAALKEVREAFRDVKHVFEVQRCFRDLRECFRDVRRAYKGREPKPRALPPCADAPACAAAAAAAANTIVDVVAPVSVQVSSKSSQTIASMDTSVSPLSTNTSERAVQTVSTGPVLALNLIHDE